MLTGSRPSASSPASAAMAALATGAVQVHHDEWLTWAGLHGGFLQIYNNTVTLLTDWARLTEGGLEEARVAAGELRAEVEQDEAEA